MRIIGGSLKGRKLFTPEDKTIRPSSSTMREALFNVLMHGNFAGKPVLDARMADICCGTGALGFEAISRGAAHATLVDESKKALNLAKQNADHLGVTTNCQFVQGQATRLPPATSGAYDLIITDPPYQSGMIPAIYDSAIQAGWLKPGSIFVAEFPLKSNIPELKDAENIFSRRYGKAMLNIWEVV